MTKYLLLLAIEYTPYLYKLYFKNKLTEINMLQNSCKFKNKAERSLKILDNPKISFLVFFSMKCCIK